MVRGAKPVRVSGVGRSVAIASASAVGLLVGCSSGRPTADPASVPPVTAEAEATAEAEVDTGAGSSESQPFEDVVNDAVADQPGGVEVLRRLDGVTVNIAAGVADADGAELAPGRPFRIGSVSKMFVATVVLQLVDEGRVELDQPLDTYLPNAALGGSVTVRQLLSHRSGLPNYTHVPEFADVFVDLDRWFTPDEVLALVAAEPVDPPGDFEYSNTNYILLGQLIEAVDERSLAESLQVRIAEPLGLTSTVLPTRADPLAVVPVGAWEAGLLDGQPDAPYDSVASSAWAAGAMISSSNDLLEFLDALFGGELVTEESLTEMVDVRPDGATNDSGYGLGIMTIGVDGLSGLGHDGAIPGFTSLVVYDPATGDVLIGLKSNPEIDTLPILRRAGRP